MTRGWMVAALLVLAGCEQGTPPDATAAACGKDTDCKGDRICEAGQCVAPKGGTATAAAPAAATEMQGGIPVCAEGDGKTRIPVWKPRFDEKGMDSEPPQGEGRIVYIDFQDSQTAMDACASEELKSFSVPDRSPEAEGIGGLEVNIRGNTQYANGGCIFRGYYMNEPVSGMHQGWMSTLFKPLDIQELVLAGRYCRER
jgi:hypothetical protein